MPQIQQQFTLDAMTTFVSDTAVVTDFYMSNIARNIDKRDL